MTPTQQYIAKLRSLSQTQLSAIRAYDARKVDDCVELFDFFATLWWPLRQKSPKAPRRSVALLIARLYAKYPIPHKQSKFLPLQIGRILRKDHTKLRSEVEHLPLLSFVDLEPVLKLGLGLLQSERMEVDWVALTDDLSGWEYEEIRFKWLEQLCKGLEIGD